MRVCFIGHREIEKTEKLITLLKETIITLIKKGATTFLFGSMSAFDDFAWEIVTNLKKQYPFIKRVYVRATYPHINKSYEKYLLGLYEETYFPQQIEKAGKYSYVERNCEMIEKSTYCIFYYNENYLPPLKQPSKQNLSFQSNRKSGTKIAYEYAKRKKKLIINLYDHIKKD